VKRLRWLGLEPIYLAGVHLDFTVDPRPYISRSVDRNGLILG
jgi:hypothetical protein